MSESLNVVALISGGKDSLFCLAHCVQNGHKVVALANLYPSSSLESGDEGLETGTQLGESPDINSFMYQTVGHSIIPLYAEALELPLFRRRIAGTAQQVGRYYDSSVQGAGLDETEDLVPLLSHVLKEHPDVNAVCSGAILSTYQRTRIESVAVRLGLIPLSYLWQYPALPPPTNRPDSLAGLLEDMRWSGCEARIIKIATGGMRERQMWSDVADVKNIQQLISGMAPFFSTNEFWLRGAVLGEGGEYETLALDGPRHVWKRRIQIEDAPTVYSAEGGTLYAHLGRARLLGGAEDEEVSRSPVQVPTPAMFDAQFLALRGKALSVQLAHSQGEISSGIPYNVLSSCSFKTYTALLSSQEIAFVSNIFCPLSAASRTTSEQMAGILQCLKSELHSISIALGSDSSLTADNIVFSTLLLSSMDDFAAVNSIYASMFTTGRPNPPARVTIACQLPDGIAVALSVILDLGSRDRRRGLHVQSRSYWAPANIGPYSQALCVPLASRQRDPEAENVHDAQLLEAVHVAGQIPLVPQSMQMLSASFSDQAILSLQHLWRVGQERGVDAWTCGIAFLADDKSANITNLDKALMAAHTWKQAHLVPTQPDEDRSDDGSDPQEDAWDMQNNYSSGFRSAVTQSTVGQHLHTLPNRKLFGESVDNFGSVVPPIVVAEVTGLPRQAPVEWWSLGISGLNSTDTPPDQNQLSVSKTMYAWGGVGVCLVRGHLQKGTVYPEQENSLTRFVTILIRQGSTNAALPLQQVLDSVYLTDSVMSEGGEADRSSTWKFSYGTAYINSSTDANSYLQESGSLQLCLVPCHSVMGTLFATSTEHSVLADDGKSLFELSIAIVLRLSAEITISHQ